MKNLEEIILSTTAVRNETAIEPSQRHDEELLKAKLSETSQMLKETPDPDKPSNESSAALEPESFGNIKLADINNLACLAPSLAAYLITTNARRNDAKLRDLTVKIYDAVNLWLARLFRFPHSSVLFHEQEADGLIRMCNIILNYKCKEYQKLGYKAFNKEPCVYISAASKYALPEFRQLISIHVNFEIFFHSQLTIFHEF